MEGGLKQSYFQKNDWNAQFLSAALFLSKVSFWFFIKTDKMKCLRSMSNIKIQICGVKAACMLFGYLFCFGVTDQTKDNET